MPDAEDTPAGVLQRVRRFIRSPGGQRMRRPDGRRHYTSLVVADVDLDTMTATAQPTWTPFEQPPEGVHALVWFHGQPLADLTFDGDPESLLPELPQRAARKVQQCVLEHQLRDALATPGGLRAAAVSGPAAVGHPADPTVDPSTVTVAVCTRDRPDDLRICLTAIGTLAVRVGEVLVVDNASRDDRTRRVAAEFPLARYVREPRAGLDWARNRALLEARTAVVAFADDDVVVHTGWVEGLLRAFAEEPDAVAVTGLVAPAELATPAQVLFEAHGGFGRGYERRWFSAAVDGGEVAASRHATIGSAGTGANMAFLREPVIALGGFDPALDVGTPTGGGGDLELLFRVIAAGHLVVYEPSAVVRHRHRRTLGELMRQRRGDGTGSYSWLVGAGPRYGSRQHLALLRFALWWGARYHLRNAVGSMLWPVLYPPALTRVEAEGMLSAVLRGYYRQAQEQAAEQAALHPHEPTAPRLVHPPARSGRRSAGVPVLALDLATDPLLGVDVVEQGPPSARLRVELMWDGRPQAAFTMRVGGSRVSVAHVRAEIVARLGSRVLAPHPHGDANAQPLAHDLSQARHRDAAGPFEGEA